ncbi:hypothetical protein BCT19_12715 [Vibrio splendidus]|nr:hypothetical protein BCT19_12715 [Vibrio splendidus]
MGTNVVGTLDLFLLPSSFPEARIERNKDSLASAGSGLIKKETAMHKKPHLPTKTCPICQKPFSWRKKWQRCWDDVIYCSERCRRHKPTLA